MPGSPADPSWSPNFSQLSQLRRLRARRAPPSPPPSQLESATRNQVDPRGDRSCSLQPGARAQCEGLGKEQRTHTSEMRGSGETAHGSRRPQGRALAPSSNEAARLCGLAPVCLEVGTDPGCGWDGLAVAKVSRARLGEFARGLVLAGSLMGGAQESSSKVRLVFK